MSIQEQSIQHDIPGQKSSSSMVVNRGNQLYDPHAPPDDDDDGNDVKTHENEQSNDSKYQTTQDSIRINNGKSAHPVINNKDKPQSSEFNEQHQQSSRHRNSPDYHSKSSDRRSRSPHRKRFRLSPTVTNETISSSKTKSSHRNDDRKSSTSSSSTNHKKSLENKDDHHSYRSKSSRNSHSDHRTNLSSLPSSKKSNAFNHTNNGSQRTRSNLIEIVTTESTSLPNRSEPATKSNSKKADDMLMEEMLLEEERKQNPIKPIDLDSLTIPESSNKSTISTKQSTNSTPSPTKKPYYVLHKVPHTNHTTPPRPKKPQIQQPIVDEASSRASLDDRISTIFGVPTNSSTKPPDTQPTISSVQTLTPSDKSTESPQDIKSSLLIIKKKERNSTEKISLPDDKRSNKHYTTEWLASQKPQEAPVTEEIPTPVSLPNLTSNQTTTNPKSSSNGTTMLGKLTELMEKITQKQSDNTSNPTETDEAVPMSAKHLERIEHKKQREKRQSEIAAIAKEALKPAFRKNTISKDEYKQIMKKVVTKATSANEIDRVRIGKMIDAYVEKYRLIHEHHNSKDRT